MPNRPAARSAILTCSQAEAHQPWGWWQHHPRPVPPEAGRRIAGNDGRYRMVLPRAPRSERPSGGSSSAPSVVVRAWGSVNRLTGGRKVENTRAAVPEAVLAFESPAASMTLFGFGEEAA